MATIEIDFSDTCLGIMGPIGNRTMVRPTTDGRFAVLTVAEPHRIIRVMADKDAARRYNAAIHGEHL